MHLPKLKSLSPKTTILIVVSLVAVIAVTVSVFLFRQYQQTTKQLRVLKATSQAGIDEANKKLIAKVGTLIELPKDETPYMYQITDATKFKDQAFFSQAKNGDNLLIYVQAKKAFLYRSSINRVIDVAPVNISSPSAQPAPDLTPAPTPKIH